MEESRSLTVFKASDGNNIRFEYHDALYNTADLARRYAKAGYPDRYVVFSEKQATSSLTGSRLSEGEFDKGVFMSCILRPSLFPSQAGLIGPLSTLALATTLENHTKKKIGIHWLNDIFCEGKKIGGCHIEGKLDSHTSYEYMIVTFAVRIDDKNFPPLLKDMVMQTFDSTSVSIGTIIAKNILNKFFTFYRDIRSASKYMDAYKDKLNIINKKVKYLSNGTKISARVVDVDKQSGNLVLKLRTGDLMKVSSPTQFVPAKFYVAPIFNIKLNTKDLDFKIKRSLRSFISNIFKKSSNS